MSSIRLCFKALVLLALLAGTSLAGPLSAQDGGSLELSAERLDPLVDLSEVAWRFREGDDPAWADPSYDDTSWPLVHTDGRGAEPWQVLGWFRLRLRVDSTLHHTILALAVYHVGASEIYLDGERVATYGTPLCLRPARGGEHGSTPGFSRQANPWTLRLCTSELAEKDAGTS